MKIYLILAAAENDPIRTKSPFMQPLALPILASCAPEHDYTFSDLLWEEVSSVDYEGDYDLIGISFRAPATETAFLIADKFKSLGKTVVLGGPQASVIPIKAKTHADAVVVGEGEKLWPILLEDLKNNQLRDFYISSPKEQHELKGFNCYTLPALPELTRLPLPQRFRLKGKYTFDMVFSSRGCPINCSFCAVSKLFGTQMRFKNPDEVVTEISTLKKRFYLLDDTVFGRNGTYGYYLELYQKMLNLSEKRFWAGQANLDAAAHEKGKEVIKAASKAGLTHAFVGYETLNINDMQHMATSAKMGIKGGTDIIKMIGNNSDFITNQGIVVSAWFTIGLANDTRQTVFETIDFCRKHHILPVLSPIQALEGTSFYDEMQKENKLLDRKTNISNVKLSSLSNDDFLKIFKYNLKAYSAWQIFKNMLFYTKKTGRLNRSIYESIYRLIFILITHLKMRRLLKKEFRRFSNRIS